MKKICIIVLIVVIIVIGVVLGIFIYNNNQNNKNKSNVIENEINIISEKVTDDCIEEITEEIETTSQEEKISPNCLLVLKKYYGY